MGWTSYHVEPVMTSRGYAVDRKSECDRLFTCEMANHRGKYELLKSRMVGSTCYAAVRRTIYATETEEERTDVYAEIVLTSVNQKEYYNFAYKDMSEEMLPGYCDCPKAILDLLTPTDSEYAKEWREKCREKLRRKKDPDALGNLPIGTVISFKNNNTDHEIKLVKYPASYQFKRPFWMMLDGTGYIAANHIPDNYTVLVRGE